MLRLNAAIGGRPETLMGLAGLGDLVLTCTGDLSRNRRLGLALGRGQTLDDAVREIGQVVESVQTANEVMRLARRYGLELRSEEHTSELQSLMRISYAVFCLKKKNTTKMLNNSQNNHTYSQHKTMYL